ncbi:MAG: hypothetical protein MZW92_25945 [Comamonadaceae bacterium]|nr:hypothetical protein [Comamonadaceae bacterium]
MPLVARGRGAGRQPGDGRLRPRADARPAGPGGAGRVRAADAASAAPRRRSTGSRCSSSRSARSSIWVIYVAMQTGVPAKPAANVAKLAPGFVAAVLAGSRWRWRWPARWPGCGWCAGAPGATARRCGRAWCCRPAAWRCAGCC